MPLPMYAGSMLCASCSVEVPAGANFCPGCGSRQVAPTAQTEGEQRQLTVMFIDLVGSTAMSERLDPEQLEEVVRRYQARVTTIIDASGGTVAQYLGDGVLVFFGYPLAHEDAARRALHAGLDVLGSLESINAPIKQETGEQLQLRIGVHTGPVVVTLAAERGAAGEQLAFGMTMNIASRFSDAAPPDGMAVSEATRRLAAEHFEFESMGGLTLKGVSEPMLAHHVLRELAQEEVTHSPGAMKFVNCEAELASLVECFGVASRSQLQTVVVVGEAGAGKSQLLRAFHNQIGEEALLWLEARCSHFHSASALYPVRSLVSQALDLGSVASPAEKLERIAVTLPSTDGHEHSHALLAALLGLPKPEGRALPRFSPERARSETIQAIGRLMKGLAEERTVVVVVEDLHWVDPSTLEVFDHLHETAVKSRMLLVVSHRAESPPDWKAPVDSVKLPVGPLKRNHVIELVEMHTGGRVLPDEVLESILARADGTPLFAEELTKMIVESEEILDSRAGSSQAAIASAAKAIPSTLQDSLMARLDRLELGKGVAQIAATFGRTFSEELLCKVSAAESADVRSGIQQLLDSDLVHEIDEGPTAQFMFRHALIQDAAYGSLLRRDRIKVHAKIAETLESSHPELVETEPEVIAHHYAEGERFSDAVARFQQAGGLALRKSAALEAVHHFSRALEVLMQLPESEGRDQAELVLRLSLGNAYITTAGYASEPVEREFERATDLCNRSANAVQLLSAANGLWGYHLVKGNQEAADHQVRRQIELATSSGRVRHVLMGLHAEGVTNFYQGNYDQALARLEEGTVVYNEVHEVRIASDSGRPWRDAAITCPMYLGWCQHLIGQPERALDQTERALEQAAERHDIYHHVEAMTHLVALRHDRREPEKTLELSDRIISTSEEFGFRFWIGIGLSARGWAQCHLGELQSGMKELKQGQDAFRSTGAMVPLAYRASYLVESCLLADRPDEGLEIIDDAMDRSRGNLDRFYDAEMLRLRGDLLHRSGESDAEVCACFRGAVALAAQQGARMLELRAAVSLFEALARSGKQEEVRPRLEELCAGFDPGLDLLDLREARASLRN